MIEELKGVLIEVGKLEETIKELKGSNAMQRQEIRELRAKWSKFQGLLKEVEQEDGDGTVRV